MVIDTLYERSARQKLLRQDEPGMEDGLAKEAWTEPYKTRIIFKSRGRILFLPVSDIRWISAEENYVRICAGTETHLLRQTMTSIEQRLDPRMFLRVHRSTIVNLRYVKEVRTEQRGDFVVHLVEGQKLAMSRSYKARINELVNELVNRV
jgi:two-component system, LytTR family, response regulator